MSRSGLHFCHQKDAMRQKWRMRHRLAILELDEKSAYRRWRRITYCTESRGVLLKKKVWELTQKI